MFSLLGMPLSTTQPMSSFSSSTSSTSTPRPTTTSPITLAPQAVIQSTPPSSTTTRPPYQHVNTFPSTSPVPVTAVFIRSSSSLSKSKHLDCHSLQTLSNCSTGWQIPIPGTSAIFCRICFPMEEGIQSNRSLAQNGNSSARSRKRSEPELLSGSWVKRIDMVRYEMKRDYRTCINSKGADRWQMVMHFRDSIRRRWGWRSWAACYQSRS